MQMDDTQTDATQTNDTLAPSPDRSGPNSLLQQCLAAQARHQLFSTTAEQPRTVIVAVSGGADSVALLHVLQRLAPVWQLTLHVAHVDHNLRPESGDDAHFVAQLVEHWGLPFHSERLASSALTTSSEGIEAAGRQARYRFFTETALTVTPPTQTPLIALAHHADDQAETLLLHLVRGSGLRGLGGMRWVSSRRVGDLWPDARRHDRDHHEQDKRHRNPRQIRLRPLKESFFGNRLQWNQVELGFAMGPGLELRIVGRVVGLVRSRIGQF